MTVDEFIAGLASPQHEIAQELRGIVREAAPEAAEDIKWRMPVFEQDGLLCYIASAKEYVRFGFYQGARLADPDGVLEEGSGKGKHIRLTAVADIPSGALADLVRAAVVLNAE